MENLIGKYKTKDKPRFVSLSCCTWTVKGCFECPHNSINFTMNDGKNHCLFFKDKNIDNPKSFPEWCPLSSEYGKGEL